MKIKMRTPFMLVHRWTGMTLGLLFLFLALTGLALVFRDALAPRVDTELHSEATCAAPLPLDRLTAAAREAHAGVRVDEIRLHGSDLAVVRMSDRRDLYVDRCSAVVRADRERWAGVFGALEQWHRFRFLESNDVANFITGSAGLAMLLVMGLGGLFVLWPSSLRQLRSVTTPRPHLRGLALDLNLHRSVGFYTAAVIVVVAATSLPMAFKWVRTVINVAVGSPTEKVAKPKSVVNPGAKPLSAEALWQQVRPLLARPDEAPETLTLSLAKKPDAAAELYVVEAGAAHPNARSYYWLDAYSGRVLRAEPYASSSLGNRIYRYTSSLHSGEVGGLPVQLLFFTGIAGVPLLAFTGLRSFLRRRRRVGATVTPPLRLRVAAVREEACDVKSFELVAADGRELPPFRAGAHIDVLARGDLMRQYSLCNDPAERQRYVIAVKRDGASRGGSAWLHDDVSAGDMLLAGLPRNHFPLRPEARQHVLMAAGIGITPLLAMARELMRDGGDFVLHYFARSPEQMAFHAELSGPAFQGRVHFHYAVGRARLGDLLRQILWQRGEGAHLYICGPQGFMELVETTAAASWPPQSVHVEHFGADPLAFAGERHPFAVELRRSGCTLQVPADQSIAQVLKCHGLNTFTSCEQGVCGSCITGVLGGTPDHRDAFLSPAERQAGNKMLVCVSRARSETLVLDL